MRDIEYPEISQALKDKAASIAAFLCLSKIKDKINALHIKST